MARDGERACEVVWSLVMQKPDNGMQEGIEKLGTNGHFVMVMVF